MSIDHPNPAVAGLAHLRPAVIQDRLGDLIRAYVEHRSSALAESVVAHLEALCLHAETRDPGLFCAYRQLARHWRWLAGQGSTAVLAG